MAVGFAGIGSLEARGSSPGGIGHVDTPPPHMLGFVGADLWAVPPSGGTAIRDPAKLHPVVRAAREEHIKTSLAVGDVSKSPSLMEHFQRYALRDFFDQRGQRRYQNLSMSLAAKQNPDIAGTFGSSTAVMDAKSGKKGNKHLSARAYRLATEMVQRDRDAIRQKNTEQYECLDEAEKVQLRDVQGRQEGMLFLEIPEGQRCLPRGCTLQSILPVSTTRTQERDERRRFEKLNTNLLEGGFQSLHHVQQQSWVLPYDQVMEVVSNVTAWIGATGISSALGVERSTFCRFLLDVGIVDQQRVPFVWAVSVFDRHARFVRICNGDPDWCDPHMEGRIPVLPVICKWDFMVVLDVLLRRGISTEEFILRLRVVAKRLKAEWHLLDAEEKNGPGAHEEEQQQQQQQQQQQGGGGGGTPGGGAAGALSDGPRKIPTFQNGNSQFFDIESLRAAAWAPPTGGASVNENTVWRRNRRISGMLVEPEVLQLVEQYRSLFLELFQCYASDATTGACPGGAAAGAGSSAGAGKTMEFVMLLQFCQDFRIIPRIASRHEVLRAYRATASVDWVTVQPPPQPREASPAGDEADASPSNGGAGGNPPRTSRAPQGGGGSSGNTPRASAAARRFGASPTGDRPEHPPGSTPHTSVAARRLPAFGDLSPSARSPAGEVAQHAADVRPANLRGSFALGRRSPLPDPSPRDSPDPSAVPERAQQRQGPQLVLQYGLAAFVETLCRVAFGYLLVYGNTVQLATSSRAKMAWLIAYLHGVFTNLQKSHKQRLESTAVSQDDPSGGRRRSGSDSPGPAEEEEQPRASTSCMERWARQNAAASAWPTPPPTASGVSRRLARVLERLGHNAFLEPEPPQLQQVVVPQEKPSPQPPHHRFTEAHRHHEEVADAAKQGAAAGGATSTASAAARRGPKAAAQGAARKWQSPQLPEAEREKEEAEPRRRPEAQEFNRRTAKLRKAVTRLNHCSPGVTDEVEAGPPPDLFKLGDMLFNRLLRTSATAPDGGPSSVGGDRTRGPQLYRGARQQADSDVHARPARRPACSLDCEREALTKDLDITANSLDRCTLTPPPMSAFAVQLKERVDRMMTLSPH